MFEGLFGGKKGDEPTQEGVQAQEQDTPMFDKTDMGQDMDTNPGESTESIKNEVDELVKEFGVENQATEGPAVEPTPTLEADEDDENNTPMAA